MKATRYVCYVCCVLLFACLANAGYIEKPPNKIEQQFLDAFATDESLKTKRPFCNAFTGCGKKRNFQENPTDFRLLNGSGTIRLPLSVYKALLRAAAQNVRSTANRESDEYRMQEIPQVYLAGKMPSHKRFDVPSISLE